jgi:DNA-binding MarR family transcriptional regulator
VTDRDSQFRKKSINYWVHALASSLAKGASRYYGAKFGIRLPEMRVLSNLGTYSQLASRDIVELSAMDKGLVSRVLSGLEGRDWVQVVAEDRGARLRRYELTVSGQDMVEKLRPVWRSREAQIQHGLTALEREQLVGLLKKLFLASEDLREIEARDLASEKAKTKGKQKFSMELGKAADDPVPAELKTSSQRR